MEDGRTPGAVRLKTDKKHEAASYADIEPHHEAAALLSTLSHYLPTHLIWAEIEDVVPGFIRDSLSNAHEGRRIQSVATIPGADHMVSAYPRYEFFSENLCRLYNSVQTRLDVRLLAYWIQYPRPLGRDD